LTSEEDVAELYDRIDAELGGLDVCAAVAGVWPEEDIPVWKFPTVSPMTRSTLEDPSVLDRATNTMALRKAAEPEDIARQVVVLASDEMSGHVTGQVVVVAGGMEGRLLHSS
jgi:NAD(P)-dependent dehydrogenase (short-subunit alcohol dehydrogenase family)